ncbi:WD40-repeat-containing domain protein [Rhizoctonia solani]|nr:WD40-repeat-containing domain protein [Rhizoctonia solani]
MDSTPSPSKPKGFSRARNYFKTLGRIAKDKLGSSSRSTSVPPFDDSGTGEAVVAPTSPYRMSSVSVHRSEPALSPSLSGSFPLSRPQITSPNTSPTTVRNKDDMGWEGLRSTLQVLHGVIELFPPLQSAIGTLVSCLDLFEAVWKNQQEYDDLASELREIAVFLAQHLQGPRSTHMIGVIGTISRTIDKELKSIAERQSQSTGRQIFEARYNEDILLRDYRRIENLFRRLQVGLDYPKYKRVTRLESLTPAKLAAYNSTHGTEVNRRTCTKNTREAVLGDLNHWSEDANGKRIYWMNGMAGTGKTTIACSLAQALEASGQLGGSFFCSRASPECRDANRIIPTIAYQLARFSTPFRAALFNVLDCDPDLSSRNITSQFEGLLKGPLMESKDRLPGTTVVIIDALDECDSPSAVRLVLEVLLKFTSGLPIKFFVTSRPDPRIYDKMSQNAHSQGMMHLHEIERSIVQADIERYLKAELSHLAPKEAQILQLKHRLGNILSAQLKSTKKLADIDHLYSTILTSALKNDKLEPDEARRMQLVLWTTICLREPVDMDTLTALVGTGEKKHIIAALKPLRSVLHVSETSGMISTLHASFSDYILSWGRANGFFCDRETHNLALAAKCFNIMRANLRFNICNLASSFVPDSAVPGLEERITANISTPLFYACKYWGDHFILALASEKIGQELSEFLSHRLLFWMEVLNLKGCLKVGLSALSSVQKKVVINNEYHGIRKSATDAYTFLARISSFVFERLMDVGGTAIKRREIAPLAIWQTEKGHNCYALSSNGTVSIWDATNGMLIAGPTEPRGHSIFAIGVSSNSKFVVAGYENGTISIWDGGNGSPLSGPFYGHLDSVLAVAFVPDNKRIVSGSRDHTVCVWNALTGVLVTGPLEGHTASVHSIAVSPNGKRILSGSADHSIRVWSSSDGASLAALIEGHTGPVCIVSGADDNTVLPISLKSVFKGHTEGIVSVDFSPDSKQVVSGSYDCTIRVWDRPVIGFQSVGFSPYGAWFYSGSSDGTVCLWDATSRTIVDGIPRGHTNSIESVQFSPDDHTICVWDGFKGTPVAGPFRGHTAGVTSIAFSSDGTRIISSAFDRTICVWNSSNGELILGPCQAHVDWVKCVRFSPDGAFFVSCSDDGTICVWDATQGVPVVGPFHRHTAIIWALQRPHDWVSSVSFSPNGQYIGSGSGIQDRTVCIWDATDGKLVRGPLRGHEGGVLAIAFSSDSKRIVSSSDDRTIRVWDVESGNLVIGPLKAHTQSVRSVCFSPNGAQIVSGSRDQTICIYNLDYPHNHSDALDGMWEISDGGWFKNEKSQLLFWAPPELRRSFPRPYNPITIGPEGSLTADYSRLYLGENWYKCYRSH